MPLSTSKQMIAVSFTAVSKKASNKLLAKMNQLTSV